MDNKGGAGSSLRKHLNAAGIHEWEDISRASLYDFHDTLCSTVAPSTAKTVMGYCKALLGRYSDTLNLPSDWQKILTTRGCKPVRAYLTPEELRAFEAYKPKNEMEAVVKAECLIEAYTGARISDVLELTEENFSGGSLTYTSKKTKVTATVPTTDKIKGLVSFVRENYDKNPSMVSRERIIRRIARAAGITSPVSIFKAGKPVKGPKCDHITSHTFRISFVTNLQLAGIDMVSLSRLAGHTNTAMTERYCAPTAPKLTDMALAYFGV